MKKVAKNAGILAFLSVFATISVFAQSSTNYKLNGYSFGAGGGFGSSTNYGMEGIAGEQDAGDMSSANYGLGGGLNFAQQGNVPPAPTFTNDSGNRYNKLKIVINKDAGDPTDATYAVAISTDSFVTTQWVQSDFTVGATLGPEDFQTYASWGSAGGSYIIGLTPGTTYQVKVKSSQGLYTETGLGPSASASTVNVKVAMDIDIGGSSDPGETADPYTVAIGDLTPGTAVTATNRIWVDFDTNAEFGGYVYIRGQNTGLKSTSVNTTITSATADLAVASTGYGGQISTVAQGSGGPLAKVAPYDGASSNVGLFDSTIRELFSSTALPIVAGRGSLLIKAKAATTTPSASDYADTLTLVAAATF